MKFNSGNNSMYADALFWSGANTSSFPVDPDFTRSANLALDKVIALIQEADNTWEWNDNNISAELIDATTALASGTQKYAISVTWLKIARVRIKDANGNWITLEPVNRRELSDAQLAETGTPWGYFKLGGYIYLVGTPNYSQSAGIEVQFQRGADYFVVGDTTKEPGYASQFHRLIPLYSALDYLEANEVVGKRINAVTARIKVMEEQLQSFYADRSRDEVQALSTRSEDYGGICPVRLAMLNYPLNANELFALRKGGFVIYGSATLASGTVAITDRRIQPSSLAFVAYITPAGTTGTNLKAVCTADTLTITAVGTGGSTVTTDTSVVAYIVIL